MSHEDANTLIASLGLLIALLTAWHQFGPSPDQLSVESGGRINLDLPFQELRPFFTADEYRNAGDDAPQPRTLAGPIFWKVVFYNPLDRPVSLLELEVFMAGRSGGLIQYTDMTAGILNGSSPSSHLSLPVSVGARHAKAIVLGLNIPIAAEPAGEEVSCFQADATLPDVERCYFARGHDLFGNSVEYTEYPRASGDRPSFNVSWPGSPNSPTFLVVVRTGDGSELVSTVQYYPSF